ncbi:16000_t:CDS:2 [Funneliformis mosseae]|uniref:16000_t:CDS:1 n=1 Tax=Funneliformis mosseae TaxID=27381 RepID=A0A9N8YSJ2_FUNMO|nr:16000_t:CDS:2 [Funneliformis mosseae]
MTYAEAAHLKLLINNKSPSNNIQNRFTSFFDISKTIPLLVKKVKELENKFKLLFDLFNDIKKEVMIQKYDNVDEIIPTGQQNIKETINQ